jgi:hypothetical protein
VWGAYKFIFELRIVQEVHEIDKVKGKVVPVFF